MALKRWLPAFFLAGLLVACGGAPGSAPGSAPGGAPDSAPPQAAGTGPAGATSLVLAAGSFELPAADAFGQAGFHEVIQLSQPLPALPPATAGMRLVLTLRDSSRPQQACDSDHPLSGCATVDWSDFESRPKVPAGGVFDNRLTLPLAGGPHDFFLSESGALAAQPDAYSPG